MRSSPDCFRVSCGRRGPIVPDLMPSSGTSHARIYFSDHFEVSPETLEEHGAFDVSLIGDLPLFVDPFLLFNSEKPEYQRLHDGIIEYMRFLRDMSLSLIPI